MAAPAVASGAYRAQLGEGPLWDGTALWFVDIIAPCVGRMNVDTGAVRTWRLPNWCVAAAAARAMP
jgi:sugar lactone lactonase YvrE